MKLRYHLFAITVAAAGLVQFKCQAAGSAEGTCLESLHDTSGTCTILGAPPTIEGASFLPESAKTKGYSNKDVFGCCSNNIKPGSGDDDDEYVPAVIGSMPQFTTEQSLDVLASAKAAWNHGRGVWPQMSQQERIVAIEAFLEKLHEQRTAIINLLMWEIGKNHGDAAAEFDRTIAFCKKVCVYSTCTCSVQMTYYCGKQREGVLVCFGLAVFLVLRAFW